MAPREQSDSAPDVSRRVGRHDRVQMIEETCAVIDGVANSRVLVFGSLPPDGHDLDLLVLPAEESSCREALIGAGFAVHGQKLARFQCSLAYQVELQPVAELSLAADAQAALFADAVALPGRRNLCEPAPHHRLLLLACYVLDDAAKLDVKRRDRITRALDEDASAWETAAAHADGWSGAEKLRQLRATYARKATRRRRSPLGRRGMVIALSGIDGSGKSSQAASLQGILEQLGYDTAVAWVPMASNRSLNWIGRPLKRVLRRFESLSAHEEQPNESRGRVPNEGSALRDKSAVVTHAWATAVVLVNAFAHMRAALPHLAAGRIIIFDRYVLDSIVRLRFYYGERQHFLLQRMLVRLLSPRPTCTFLLDVSASASLTRKDDLWNADELSRQVELYRSEYAALGVQRMDGELPLQQLCTAIAESVWRRLP